MNKTIDNILNTVFRIRWILCTLFLLLTYRAIGLEGDQVLIGLTCRNLAWLFIAIFLFRQAIHLRKAIRTQKETHKDKTESKASSVHKSEDKVGSIRKSEGKATNNHKSEGKAAQAGKSEGKDQTNHIKKEEKKETRDKKTSLPIILTSLSLIAGTIFLASFLYLQSNVMLDFLVGPRIATLRECIVNPKIIPSWITGHDTELTGINENGYTKNLPLTPALTQRAYDELDRNKKVRVTFYEHVRRVIVMDKTEDILWHNIWQ